MIDDLGSDGVLHVLLDETLEIARAVGSAVALFGKIGDDALVPGEGGAALDVYKRQSHTLPPITQLSPMGVMPPRIVAPS